MFQQQLKYVYMVFGHYLTCASSTISNWVTYFARFGSDMFQQQLTFVYMAFDHFFDMRIIKIFELGNLFLLDFALTCFKHQLTFVYMVFDHFFTCASSTF